jgi:MscS family membrane protein
MDHTDWWDLRRLWKIRNEQLSAQWGKIKKVVLAPDDRNEMRLDDQARNMIDWIQREYKVAPVYWKNPIATVKEFQGKQVVLQLWFYVDNIRLEHYNRANRVRSEIARQVREMLAEIGPLHL